MYRGLGEGIVKISRGVDSGVLSVPTSTFERIASSDQLVKFISVTPGLPV